MSSLLSALPASAGAVRRVDPSLNNDETRLVVHIQDVHMNGEAQANIAQAVQALLESGQVDVMGLEGAFDSIHLEPFKRYGRCNSQ